MVDIADSPGLAPRCFSLRMGVWISLGCASFAVLAGCASGGGAQSAHSVSYYEAHARHDYNPPGPPSDPWGPYIRAASARFDVPVSWIRQVMRVESGGHEYIGGHLTVSSAGAMGLMQLEPETYQEMANQYGLGQDPFNPYDNIMAGTAYIHAMYELYGSPGFLAAYDAGPGRLNAYIDGQRSLPDETINYVAMIAPHIQGYYPIHRSDADELALNNLPISQAPGILPPGFVPDAPAPAASGGDTAMELASNEPVTSPAPGIYSSSSVVVGSASLPSPPPAATPAPIPAPPQTMIAASSLAAPQLAALPPPPPTIRQAVPTPQHSFSVIPAAMADTPPPPPPVQSYAATTPHHSGWAIQVGAYDSSSNARAALGIAELTAVQMLMRAQPVVMSVHLDGHTKYRARFVGLVHEDAVNACSRLASGPTGCMVLPPEAQS